MRASDVFGIVVRVFGLSMTLYSLWSLATNMALSLSVPEMDGLTAWFAITGIAGLVLGIYFLRGAPLLLRFSYPNEK